MSMYTTSNIHSVVSGGPHRAIVTYSNTITGEIRVRVPAVLGQEEINISLFGRAKTATGWPVPAVNSQVLIGTDDQTFTNVFILQTEGTSKLEARIAELEAQVANILETLS